jgi:bifunctional lysine-specific demethylase and histidyl-hydroxylase NO66
MTKTHPGKSDRLEKRPREVQKMAAAKKAKAEATPFKKAAGSAHATTKRLNFFSWLLNVSREEFFHKYFEKEHLVVSHGTPAFFQKGLLGVVPPVDWSTQRMLELAKAHPMHYGTDLNVVRFDPKLKKRVPYRTEGPVDPAELERCMKEGWSVRFLRPNEFIECNSAFVECMEGEFSCYCGVNSYWTPASSQGFAPHYDDVDVFLLQLEGEKMWYLYDPPEDVDYLSRHSSEDYVPEQFPRPKHEILLKAGDVLYMPRGMVHQGKTTPSTHSLHITFSANQMNSWADFMSRAAQYTVETLAANHIEWRRALPREMPMVMGEMNHPVFRESDGVVPLTERQQQHRAELQTKVRELAAELTLLLTDEAHMDVCTDVYAKDTVQKMQPPSKLYSGAAPPDTAIEHNSRVRLISRNCLRMMLNVPGEARVFHIGLNSRVCLAGELDELRFEVDFAPAIATLISSYPKLMAVDALPFPGFDDPEDVAENQLLLTETLRDAGLLHIEEAK